MSGCTAPTITVGGVTLSTDDFTNAKDLLKISGDKGDPVMDAYEENIASGNNTNGTKGVQFPAPVQTSPPPPITATPVAQDNTVPIAKNGTVPGSVAVWTGDYDLQLSPNFKVRNFTINAVFPNQLIDYLTYTAASRCANLQGLAINVAEAMLAKFGRFNINSGLRNASSTPSGVSQHILGQAIDIQIPGWTYAKYWDNAAWVRDNIPYDQFIFEHSSSTGLAWYHLSYNIAGNRASTVSTKVMTMYQNHYSPGLQRHG